MNSRSIDMPSSRWEGQYYFLGFLIWPLGMMFEALRNWKNPWSKNLFWVFCIFFGYTFVIAEFGGADSDRYARLFLTYSTSELNLDQLWQSFYTEGSGNIDIVSPLIIYLVSRVSHNPSVLFMVFGAIFGFFYSRNLWYLLERMKGKPTVIILLYLLTFALFNPVWNINGLRFWLASQIFLFGALPFIYERNWKMLPWAAASILVHFSFLFPASVLFIYFLARNRLYLYLLMFISTSFIREIQLDWFRSFFSFLPPVFFSEIQNYTSAEYHEARSLVEQELPWFITYSNIGIRWANYILITTILLFGRRLLRESRGLKSILSFSLLFFAFANIMSIIPSGNRFIVVVNTFIFAFYILFFTEFSEIREIFIVKWLPVPFLLLFCMVSLRIGMDFAGVMTVIGNPVSAVLYTEPATLIDAIKNLF